MNLLFTIMTIPNQYLVIKQERVSKLLQLEEENQRNQELYDLKVS